MNYKSIGSAFSHNLSLHLANILWYKCYNFWFLPTHRYTHHTAQLVFNPQKKCSSGLVYLRSPASSHTRFQCQTDAWCAYMSPLRVSSTVTRTPVWGSAGAHLRSFVIWIDEVSVFMLECQCQGGTHGTYNSCTGTLPHGLPQPTIHPLRVSKTFMCLDVRALAH